MKNEIRERLVELLDEAENEYLEAVSGAESDSERYEIVKNAYGFYADHLIAHGVTFAEFARPLEEWHEDYGDVLWWKFPIEEPPYVGSPLDEKWGEYCTHWTPIVVPEQPQEVE